MIGVMCVIGVGTVLPLGSSRPPAPALEAGMAPIYPVVTGNKTIGYRSTQKLSRRSLS